MTLAITSAAVNSAVPQRVFSPKFREKDAVCIEACALQTTTRVKPERPASFLYTLATMQIAAQQLREQSVAPMASAHKVAFQYQRHNITVRSGAYEARV